jgi:hypothetical protein
MSASWKATPWLSRRSICVHVTSMLSAAGSYPTRR